MLATMCAAAAIAGVYVVLIGRHLYKAAESGRPHRRRATAERLATIRLFTGDLDRAGYRAELETLAALDAVERPLTVPAAEH
jgi:transcription elongation GreA/GreB family factor